MRAVNALIVVMAMVAMVFLSTPWVQFLSSADGDYSDTVSVPYDAVPGGYIEVPAEDAPWQLRTGMLYGMYNFVLTDDPAVSKVADALASERGPVDDSKFAEDCRRWVHENIAYVTDMESQGTSNRWQTPYETLRLGTGDCEDMAILLASILGHLGFDTVLIHGLLRAVEIVVQIENVEGAGRRFRLCVRRENLLDGIFALGQGDLALPEGLQVLEQQRRAQYQGAAGRHRQRPEPLGPGETQVHGFLNQIVAHIAQSEEQLFFRLHTKIPSS